MDVIIVGRGGGSIEDLWPFNEEIVARTIYDMKTPVISAVGHEIDFTISDLVSDLRAPTPTAAAEMAVPNMNDLINTIKQLNIRLNETINSKINFNKLKIDALKNSYVIKNPVLMFENKKQKIDLLNDKLNNLIELKIDNYKKQIDVFKHTHILLNPNNLYKEKQLNLKNLIEKLQIINPLNVLNRGYSLTYKNDKIINDINNIDINDKLDIKLSNGNLKVNVIAKENK